ncbi:glycosyltransferase family 4 protein [Malikia sp.]|uniref:glycosyltransferase family 4 protein n=1 Tax=Malikia sp. TaxID=2070706 RepID=UPI002607DBB0|nr:glycosyltransferase family 4 protein [Malikia sp.]
MTKILFVTSKSLGGSGKYISTLASALRDRGHHCELVYFPLGVAQDTEIEAAFAAVHHFDSRPGFSPIAVAANVKKVRSILKAGRFDWVHTHTSLGGLFGRLGSIGAGASLKVGHTIHAYGADEFTPVPQKWVYWAIERFLDDFTDAYVSPSKYMVEYGRRTHVIRPHKATVIYNSLQLKPVSPEAAELRRRKREELGVADGEIVYLFCGRLERQKGVDVLIASLGKLPKDLAYRLVICGIGDDGVKLRAQAEQLGVAQRITWAGWQTDLEPFYAAADAYVMPSRWESFGLVFLEAMNHSLPVASTRTQAIPEVVADGETGLLSLNEDADGFAQNLLKLALNAEQRRTLGRAGKQRLESHFRFERFVDEHVSWYAVRKMPKS